MPYPHEPLLGCNCQACYYARKDHIEEVIKQLYIKENEVFNNHIKLPIVSQYLQHYLHGSISYVEMKNKIIEDLWSRVQANIELEIKANTLKPIIIIPAGEL